MGPLALAALLLSVSARAGVIEVPRLSAPLNAPPALATLAADLAILNPTAGVPLLPASLVAMTPASWGGLQTALAAPVAAELKATPAARRVEFARETLGRFEPEAFAKLPDGDKDALLEELWDGWKARGLAGEPDAFGQAVLAAVDDKALTSAGKSVFLGSVVLGYPLNEALWLARTRIGDALDENSLTYPRGQRWTDPSGTPEFLGTTKAAQELLDAWGRAVDHSRRVAALALAGEPLPQHPEISAEATAGFAALVRELSAKGDEAALKYLKEEDPTFIAFLLDARKPGYYLYNGDKGVVGRILATKAAKTLGLRRVEHPDPGLANYSSTYLYRPKRVLERLDRVIADEAAGEDAIREALSGHRRRLAGLRLE